MMINLRSGETGSIHVFFIIIIMVLLTWFGLLVQSAIAEEKSDKDKDKNLLKNGCFENWTEEPSSAPEGWGPGGLSVSDGTGTVTREDKEVKGGVYSARLTEPVGGEVFLQQMMTGAEAAALAGKTISMGVWVKQELRNTVVAMIFDFVPNASVESKTTGAVITGQWGYVTVTKKIRKDAIRVGFRLILIRGGEAYLDEAVVCEGDRIPQELSDNAGGGRQALSQKQGEDVSPGPPVAKNKKLLAWFGRDASDRNITGIDYLREHRDFLEKRFAIDGFLISVTPDWGRKTGLHLDDSAVDSAWWGGARFKREDFKEVIKDMRFVSSSRFRHNYLMIRTTPFYTLKMKPWEDRFPFHAPDWFNDEDWDRVRQNAAVAAYVARKGRFKGVMMDTEDYSGQVLKERELGLWRVPFAYRNHYASRFCQEVGVVPHTYQECADKVRQRGREYMKSMTDEYPDITVMLRAGGWSDTGLSGPFIEGLLEAKGKAAVVVDLGGYNSITYEDFSGLRRYGIKSIKYLADNPEFTEKNVEFSFGIWLNPAPGDCYPPRHIKKNLEYNFFSPEQVEHGLYNALTVSDRYVWMFANDKRWWYSEAVPNPIVGDDLKTMPREVFFSRTPQAYLDALKNCRQSHNLKWRPSIDNKDYAPASKEPGYDEKSTFGDLWQHFDLVKDLPIEWKFAPPPTAGVGDYRNSAIGGDAAFGSFIRTDEFWENQGFKSDGTAWYRVRFGVPEQLNGKPLKNRKLFFCFGAVAGNAGVYLNGVSEKESRPIYSHGRADWMQKSYNERFMVEVSNYIRLGKENALTVSVENYGGPGGIWKPVKLLALKEQSADFLKAKADNNDYSSAEDIEGYDEEATFGDLWSCNYEITKLPEEWLFKFDPENNQHQANTDISSDKGWEKIKVTDFWENQGYPYDGVAWYRVRFRVPTYAGGFNTRLCFGAVAGGVELFLNGSKEPFAVYHLDDYEWQRRFEIYLPPGQFFLLDRDNVLTVKVTNYKGPGGIWKPVKLIGGY